jgi:tripartite-type tricarboxylate transporter receptor subunit TctC
MRVPLTILALLALVCSAQALDYPTKPVRVLVGWAPGGVSDVAARIVAQKLTEKWHQQVFVENRSGASGMIADAAAARAEPDGYTLLLASSPEVTTTPFIHKTADKFFLDSLIPVALVSINPLVVLVPPESPYKSINDLITAAKANPGAISYASPGIGTAPHLAALMFEDAAKVKFQHVPYRGGGPAAVAVASGDVPLGFNAMAGAAPLIKAGRIKVLGVATAKRIPSAPEWPTVSEQGMPNFEYTVWTGLFVQKGVPVDIVKKLVIDLQEILSEPDVAGKFAAFEAIPGNEPLNTFLERIKRDTDANEAILRRADIQ